MFYLMMNDYNSSVIPRYLHALIDYRKQINCDWDYESSDQSFPEFMLDGSCPDSLFLLCRKGAGALKFDYYKHGAGHIVSNKLFDVIKKLKMSHYIVKKLVATSIKDGAIIRDDLNYIYFVGGERFINVDSSSLEEDKRGNIIPGNLVFNSTANEYDVLSIIKTLFHNFIFVNEVGLGSLKNFKGIKFVPTGDALNEYCKDYRYDLQGNKKLKKIILP